MNIVLSDYVRGPGTTFSFYMPLFSYDYNDINNKVTLKNNRSYLILKNEIKKEFNSYKKISCDGKEYYYNDNSSKDSYTITKYGIKNHFLYNEIYYNYNLGNYCETKEIDKLLDFMSVYYYNFEKDGKEYIINLLIGTPNNTYRAELNIYSKKDYYEVIENSKGSFKITDEKIIYKRNTKMNYSNIEIPDESTFIIKDRNTLELENNYLNYLIDKIELKNK